jgi:hypothetical protein
MFFEEQGCPSVMARFSMTATMSLPPRLTSSPLSLSLSLLLRNDNNGWKSRRHVREHLNAIHSADLPKLTDVQLVENDLYVCRECKDELFVTLTSLNNHVRKITNPPEHLTIYS